MNTILIHAVGAVCFLGGVYLAFCLINFLARRHRDTRLFVEWQEEKYRRLARHVPISQNPFVTSTEPRVSVDVVRVLTERYHELPISQNPFVTSTEPRISADVMRFLTEWQRQQRQHPQRKKRKERQKEKANWIVEGF